MLQRSNFNASHTSLQSRNSINANPSLNTPLKSSATFPGLENNRRQLHSASTNRTEHSHLRGNRFKFPWQKVSLKGIRLEALNANGHLGGTIKPNTETWLVSHGWNSKGSTIRDDRTTINLARAIDGFNRHDQVVVLDWKADAKSHKLNPREAASKIPAVGAEATRLLRQAGIQNSQLNVIGHSMGGYVVNEIAKNFGGVDRLVALDPASPLINEGVSLKKGYQVNNVNYDAVSNYAWSFYGSTLGYDRTTKTANESFEFFFLENGKERLNPSKNHKEVAIAFTQVLERNNSGSANWQDRLFNLSQMNRDGGKPWANTNKSWNKGLFGKGFDAGIKYEQSNGSWQIKEIRTS